MFKYELHNIREYIFVLLLMMIDCQRHVCTIQTLIVYM